MVVIKYSVLRVGLDLDYTPGSDTSCVTFRDL